MSTARVLDIGGELWRIRPDDSVDEDGKKVVRAHLQIATWSLHEAVEDATTIENANELVTWRAIYAHLLKLCDENEHYKERPGQF